MNNLQDPIISQLQFYLEYIKANTIDYGVRLLKPFTVHDYYTSQGKYQAIFNPSNRNDCYYITINDLNDFLKGKTSNKVNLRVGRGFEDDGRSGLYLSLSENNLPQSMESIQRLFGLRFKKSDLFFKIVDVQFSGEFGQIEDNIKIYVIEDFGVNDFIEVNKFVDTGMTVKRGEGYSIEIDETNNDEYISVSDARTAIKMAKDIALRDILSDLDELFSPNHRIGDRVKAIIGKRLT